MIFQKQEGEIWGESESGAGLPFEWYNFRLAHRSLQTPPEMASDLTDHDWKMPRLSQWRLWQIHGCAPQGRREDRELFTRTFKNLVNGKTLPFEKLTKAA